MSGVTDWDDAGVLMATANVALVALEKSAKRIRARAERNFRRTKQGTGELAGHVKVVRSKFPDGGYIVGVFDDSPPSRWEDSVGARAIFFEYGHAAPYRGRAYVKRKWVRKITTPKPGLKAAFKTEKRRMWAEIQRSLL